MKDTAIFVDNDFLILSKNNGSDTIEPLFFYFDENNKKISNNFLYKQFVIEEIQNFYDLNGFLDSGFNLGFLFAGYENIKSADLIFSDRVSQKAKQILIDFFGERFEITEIEDFDTLLIKASLKELKKVQTKVFFGYSFSDKFLLKQAELTTGSLKIKNNFEYETLYKDGISKVLSEKITTEVRKLYGKEFYEITGADEFIYWRSLSRSGEIINSHKALVSVSTRLPKQKDYFVVNLKTQEIQSLYKYWTIRTAEFFKSSGVEKRQDIFVFGLPVDIPMVAELKKTVTIRQLPLWKIIEAKDFDVESLKKTDGSSQITEMTKVELKDLRAGDVIKLSNFDARPGKGWSKQVIKYLGGKRFEVLESTRSLRNGDIAESLQEDFSTGKKLMFDIYRDGKLYGRFKTREVKKMEKIKG